MPAFDEKISRVRSYVLVASAMGLALTLILTMVRDASALNDLAFAAIVGSPFLFAILSLRLPRIGQQRWVWLGCAMLAAVAGLPLIFSGVGVLFLAMAVCYAWAFAITGRWQDASASGTRAPRQG